MPAMRNLTSEGQAKIAEIAQRYGVSTDGVLTMLDALQRGGGTMAQFSHPDFGGSGQWMRGGMTMVSDLFNNALKSRVDGVCNELSNLLAGDLSWFQEASPRRPPLSVRPVRLAATVPGGRRTSASPIPAAARTTSATRISAMPTGLPWITAAR